MKKASVWKVLLSSVATLGFYWFYWVASRRDDMVQRYRQTIPHWGWMVAPPLLVAIFMIPVIFIGVATRANTYDLVLWAMAYAVLGWAVVYAISIWWMWKFSKAAGHVTNGRMTAGWTIALYIFTGMFVILFLQYYFNRSQSTKNLKTKAMLAPTLKFKVTAIAAMVLMTSASIPFSLIDWDAVQPDRLDSHANDLFMKSERLYAEYQGCVSKLSTDFPELTDENETAYNAAQAHCEDIRIEQNKTVDEYNKVTGH